MTRVKLSPNLRNLLHDRASGGSEAATEAVTALGGDVPMSVECPSPAADALALWAGMVLEVAGDGGTGPNNDYYAEGAACSALWLKLVANGATDRVCDGTTLGFARGFAPLTWTALGNAGQTALRKAVAR